MALLNLFKFLSPFIPQTKIESAKVNEQFSKIGDSMDTIATTLDRTPVYAAGTTFPSAANAGKAMVLDASGNPTFRTIGTAADLTATTSDTDSTAGRALRVGNLGFGSQIAGIKEVYAAQTPADVLAVVGNNAHYTGNILNHGASAPEAWGIISGYITNGNGYSYSYEDFTGINGARYRRTAASASAWNSWKKVYEQGDLGTAAFLVATGTPGDHTAGRAARVGDFGNGRMLDMRTGQQIPFSSYDTPQKCWSIGTIRGFVDGAALGIPGLTSVSYGVVEIHGQYSDLSGHSGVQQRFYHGGLTLFRTQATNTTWTAWDVVGAPVLGSVAFGAGLSVGAIIERGGNANGDYVKFADGTLICQGSRAGALGTTQYAGITNLRFGEYTWFYPATFLAGSVPTVFGMGGDQSYGGWLTSIAVEAARCNVGYFTATPSPSAQIYVVAIGRWR